MPATRSTSSMGMIGRDVLWKSVKIDLQALLGALISLVAVVAAAVIPVVVVVLLVVVVVTWVLALEVGLVEAVVDTEVVEVVMEEVLDMAPQQMTTTLVHLSPPMILPIMPLVVVTAVRLSMSAM